MNKLLTALYIAGWLLLFSYASHGSTQVAQTLPEQHAVESWSKIAVLHGAIIDGQILGREDNVYTNVRFSPYGSPLLQNETVLFCGYEGDQFFGMTGPIEVRFETVAHRAYQGIGCHQLLSVAHWSPPEQKGW